MHQNSVDGLLSRLQQSSLDEYDAGLVAPPPPPYPRYSVSLETSLGSETDGVEEEEDGEEWYRHVFGDFRDVGVDDRMTRFAGLDDETPVQRLLRRYNEGAEGVDSDMLRRFVTTGADDLGDAPNGHGSDGRFSEARSRTLNPSSNTSGAFGGGTNESLTQILLRLSDASAALSTGFNFEVDTSDEEYLSEGERVASLAMLESLIEMGDNASTSMMYSFPPPFIGNRSNNGGASGALAGNNNVHSSMMHEDSLFPPLFASADQMGNELTIISDFLASLESPSNNTQAFFNAMQGYPGSRHPPNQQASSGPAARPGRSASGSSAVLSNGEHGQNPDPESLSSTERFVLTAADPMTVGTNEDRLNQVISAKFEAGLLKPYNYINSYTKLQQWMETHMSPASRTRILNVMGLFRPRFQWVAQRLTDMDLVLVEEAFERMLLEYDRVFSSMGIPSCLWRRTGEIWKCNKEFAELVGLSMDELKDGKLSIYELMSEESAVNYWEKYGNIAFDAGQKAILTSCVLKKPDEDREAAAARTLKEGVNCCFSFTIRRDRYSIPIIIAGNFLPVMDGSYSAPTPQSQARTDPAASYIGCFQGKQEDFLPYGFPFTTISECATLCLQPGPDNPYFLILSRDPHQCVCSSKCSLVQVGDDLVRVPDSICAAGCGEKNGSLCGGYGAASNQFEVYSIRKESATCSEADIVTPMNRLALSSSLLAMAVNAVVLCALVYFLIYEAEEAPQQPRVSSNWKKRVSPFNLQLFLMAVSMIAFFACLYCEALALTAASVYLLPLNFFFSATFKTIYLLHSWARAAKIISSVAPSLAKYFRFLLYLVPIFTYSVTIPAIIFAVLVLETDEELRRIANMSHDCMRILETISIIMMTFVDLGLLVCFILHIFNNTRVSVEDPVDIKFLTICYFGVVTNGLCVVAFAFQIIRFVTVVSQTRFPVNQAMLDAVTHLIFTAVLVALFAMKLALRVQVHLEIGRRRSTLEHGMTKRSSSIKSPRSSMLLSAHDPASDVRTEVQ
ncbi:hypothetical protein HDU80_003284 [Chytriomyces hyalinus]|nr:hypothetical protein HDU80_003284 [Chytriomyces hyalinus]